MTNTNILANTASARRNVIVLALAQAFGGSIGGIAIAVGALSGAFLLSPQSQNLATLPVAALAIGATLFALPVSILCRKLGRKFGFISGASFGILGALLACFSLLNAQFILFCIAFIMIGGANAFVQQYRFAAADQGSDHFKSRAISLVLTGGVFASIVGPQMVLRTKDLFAPTPFAGAFIGMAIVLGICISILLFLKPAPSEVARATAAPAQEARPLFQIMKQPVFFIALSCAISSYALMSFMMTGAPLAMVHHGHSEHHAIVGIQWHLMAMYAPSFITGRLIVRFGKIPVIAAGLFLLLLCAVIALNGLALWNFWVSLILLGVGWNFGFIGSTALLGESYHTGEKSKVQGAHDTILFSCVGAAALLSGATFNTFGWDGIAFVLLPVTCLSLLSLAWLALYIRKHPKQEISEGL